MNRDRRTQPEALAVPAARAAARSRGARGRPASLDPDDIAPWVIASARAWPSERRGPPGRARRLGVQPAARGATSARDGRGTVADAAAPPRRRARAARRARRARRAPGLRALEAQLRSSGYCARPVRLRGHDRDLRRARRRRVWSTDTEPDGVLRKACGNRREAVCPPCAERYRQDAYHLIARRPARRQGRARHGRRAPGGVRDADGAELRARAHAPARPGRAAAPLPAAARRAGLRARRAALLRARSTARTIRASGEPLCPECFDYAGAVVWNNTLGELWRYTTIYLPRTLARLAGMTQSALKREVRARLRQGRRVPAPRPGAPARARAARPRDARLPRRRGPPARARASTSSCSSARCATAVADVSARRSPTELGGGRVRWGEQLDVRQLQHRRASAARSPATWPSTRPRAPSRPAACCTASTADDVDRAPVREHVRTLHAHRVRARRARHHTAQQRATAARRQPAPDVETDWHPAALAIRVRRAMSTRRARPRPAARRHRAHRPRRRLVDARPSATAPRSSIELDDRRARAPGRRRLDRPRRRAAPAARPPRPAARRAARTPSATAATA